MKQAIVTREAPGAIGPYSQAIAAESGRGQLVFCSGQIPLDPATGALVDGGIEAQTRQCLKNVEAILRAQELSLTNVVKTTVFLQNMDDFAAMNGVYETAFTGTTFPARSAVEVAKLPKGALVEIETICVK